MKRCEEPRSRGHCSNVEYRTLEPHTPQAYRRSWKAPEFSALNLSNGVRIDDRAWWAPDSRTGTWVDDLRTLSAQISIRTALYIEECWNEWKGAELPTSAPAAPPPLEVSWFVYLLAYCDIRWGGVPPALGAGHTVLRRPPGMCRNKMVFEVIKCSRSAIAS